MNGTDSSVANDVWGTISNIASQAISYKRDVALAKLSTAQSQAKTQAAPSGVVGRDYSINPFPGTQSAFPQNDAKPAPGGTSVFGALTSPLMLMIAFGLILVLFVMRR